MVLLPCSNCCGPTCTCPACGCCTCASWQTAYDQRVRTTIDGAGYDATYYREIYDDLVALLPGCITRLYESQSECVNALVAQAMAANPGMTEQEIRDAFQAFWEEYDCQDYVSIAPYAWHGWSAPYLPNNAQATAAALDELCPSGAPPSPLFCPEGATGYWGIPRFTGSTTDQIPDIRHLVIEAPGTGDWIADALLARGTQDDLPALGWVEATDCASCADPAVLEEDCNSATDYNVFYNKTVTVRESWPNVCNAAGDELGLCPPEICKIVTITITRENQCAPHAPGYSEITTWEVQIAVCPCGVTPFVFSTYASSGDAPTISGIYGYASEQDCIDDLTNENCLGGTPSSRCVGNQWQSVRHYTSGGSRYCSSVTCVSTCAGPGCCT